MEWSGEEVGIRASGSEQWSRSYDMQEGKVRTEEGER